MVFKYSILVFNIILPFKKIKSNSLKIKSFEILKERNVSVKGYKEKSKITDKREHRTR